MPLTMKEKQAVTKQLALTYKQAGKKEKGKILDTVIELAGYNRSYTARGLRQRVKPRYWAGYRPAVFSPNIARSLV